jgi:hypothetical protein
MALSFGPQWPSNLAHNGPLIWPTKALSFGPQWPSHLLTGPRDAGVPLGALDAWDPVGSVAGAEPWVPRGTHETLEPLWALDGDTEARDALETCG